MSNETVECIPWDPETEIEQEPRKSNWIIWVIAVAAIALVATLVSLVLFLPSGEEPQGGEETTLGVQAPVIPAETDPEIQRGAELFQEQRYEEAIAALELALQGNPTSNSAYMFRGHCNFMLGRYQEAITDFTNAYRHAQDDPQKVMQAITMRGGSYFFAKFYSEAIGDLTQAINMDPASINAYSAYSYRARAYEALNEFAKAQADYTAAAALQQDQ